MFKQWPVCILVITRNLEQNWIIILEIDWFLKLDLLFVNIIYHQRVTLHIIADSDICVLIMHSSKMDSKANFWNPVQKKKKGFERKTFKTAIKNAYLQVKYVWLKMY